MKIPAEKPASSHASVLPPGGRGRGSVNTSHDRAVVGALDAIVSSSEQTYEQLMESFTYLTHADVRKPGQSTSAAAAAYLTPPSASSELSSLSDTCSLDELSTGAPSGVTKQTNPTAVLDAGKMASVPAEGDMLEEQVLGEGTKTSSIWLRSKDMTGGIAVKVDNFVALDEDSEAGDIDADVGYQASFASEGSQYDEPKGEAKSTIDQHSHTTSETTEQESNTESTDSTSRTTSSAQSRLQTVEDTASKCWAKFASQKPSVNPGSEQKEVWELLGEDEEEEEEDAAAAESDRIRIGISLFKESKHFVEDLTPDEMRLSVFKEEKHPVEDQTPDELDMHIETLSQAPAHCSQTPDEADEGSTLVSEVPSLHGPVSDKVNPGEVEEDARVYSESEVTHVSRLPFSARCKDDSEDGDAEAVAMATEEDTNSGISNNTAETDDVKAFTLDEDFDYDNVVLTPKFSQTEMALLMAAMLRPETQDQERSAPHSNEADD